MIRLNNKYLNIATFLFLGFLLHNQYQIAKLNPELNPSQEEKTCAMKQAVEGSEHVAAATHKLKAEDLVINKDTPLFKRIIVNVLRMGIDEQTLKEIDEAAAREAQR
jgi:hypothetical protein